MNEKRDFLDFIQTLLKYKKILIYTFVISTVLSIGISLLLPLWYRSSAKLLFPDNNTSFGVDKGMSMILGNVPLDLGQKGSLGNERLNSIFSSRVFLDDIITKFNLQKVYKEKFLFKTRERLQQNISTDINYDDQSITVSFDYKENSQQAYEICSYLITKADSINMELNSLEAHNNRIFIETTYFETQNRISLVEDSLQNFQQKYGTYLLDEQMSATIEVQAEHEKNLIETRLEYNYLKNVVNKDNSRLRDLEIQLKTIEEELTKLQYSTPEYSVLLPLKKVSLHAMEYYKFQRELEIGAKVLEFLTPQYEQAKIDENQSRPSFIIMDPPDIPEYKFKPKRAYVVLGATSLIMLLLLIYIIMKESLFNLKMSDSAKYDKIKNILSHFKINLT